MMQFGEQRISTPMLQQIEIRLSRLFSRLGVKSKVLAVNFGRADFTPQANYFELPADWLALCYYHKLNKEILPLSKLPIISDLADRIQHFVQENKELLGFSGIVTTREGGEALPAVFLNSEKGTSGEVCHTLIHELVHAHSYKSRGFQNAAFKEEWSKKGILAALLPRVMAKKDRLENVSKEYYNVLDEGVTELFARIITRSFALETSAPVVPRLRSIPVYEFPLAIACDLAHSFGISILAKAYFDGDLEFHKKLAEMAKIAEQEKGIGSKVTTGKYSEDYFNYVTGLDINSGNYLPINDTEISEDEKIDKARRFLLSKARSTLHMKVNRLDGLRECGITMPDPQKLSHTPTDTYNDPAVALWNEQIGNIFDLAVDSDNPPKNKKNVTHPIIALIAGAATIYTAYKLIKESK